DLRLDRLAHAGRAVAEHGGAHAAIIVDQPVAIDIVEIRPLAALEHQRAGLHALAEVAVDAARDPTAVLGDAGCGLVEPCFTQSGIPLFGMSKAKPRAVANRSVLLCGVRTTQFVEGQSMRVFLATLGTET